MLNDISMKTQLVVMEFPALICLVFLFVFILVVNIVCTTYLIKIVAKHTSILKMILDKETVVIEPSTSFIESDDKSESSKISQSLDNITTLVEKFMWFYVTGGSGDLLPRKFNR